jgi:hypothetical protein
MLRGQTDFDRRFPFKSGAFAENKMIEETAVL